jgi:hypothetical protein
MEDRRWGEWKNGKPMTVRQLARLLAPYGITPGTIRVGETTPKGYARASFGDAFARYLHGSASSDPQHCHNPRESAESDGFRSATLDLAVADEKCLEPNETATCGGVADEREGPPKREESRASSTQDDDLEIPPCLDRRLKKDPARVAGEAMATEDGEIEEWVQ